MLTTSSLLGGGNPASNYVPPSSGDPVNDQTGDLYQTSTDISIPGRGPALHLTRTYNSIANSSGTEAESAFGYGWSSSYTMNMTAPYGTPTVTNENGSTVAFPDGEAPPGAFATLTYNVSNNTYTYVRKGTQAFVFLWNGTIGQLIV